MSRPSRDRSFTFRRPHGERLVAPRYSRAANRVPVGSRVSSTGAAYAAGAAADGFRALLQPCTTGSGDVRLEQGIQRWPIDVRCSVALRVRVRVRVS